ncbi:MAG TPA: DUF2064 domain-containing protein [Ignavibacteriaceae bacterium]|nr:DUF2064 domain-containing protein [Ignavibacteriaceae bacterium]
MNKKRAVVLFTASPEMEAGNKLIGNKKINKKLFEIFRSNISKTVDEAREQVLFDFVVSSDFSSNNSIRLGSYNILQTGKNFAERFENTLHQMFSNKYEEVIIIGDDCVAFDSKLIVDAFTKLSCNDYVVGPAFDGGFYLLGLKYFQKETFKNIQWQTSTVTNELITNILNEGSIFDLLPALSDIDSERDLYEWLNSACSKTYLAYSQIIKLLTQPILVFIEIIFFISSKSFSLHFSNLPPPAFRS